MTEQLGTRGATTQPSVFTRILHGEIPGEIVLQTDDVFVLRDIAPQAPVHLLVIPKTDAYADVVELAAGDPGLLAHMVEVARTAATQAGAQDFRLIFNTGAGVGQTVFHVHAHVLSAAQHHEQGLSAAQHHEQGLSAAQHHEQGLSAATDALGERTMAGDLAGRAEAAQQDRHGHDTDEGNP